MADPTHPFDIAAQAGIDLGLIADNLRLSYEERVLKHQSALDSVLAMERVKREHRNRLAKLAAHELRAIRVTHPRSR